MLEVTMEVPTMFTRLREASILASYRLGELKAQIRKEDVTYLPYYLDGVLFAHHRVTERIGQVCRVLQAALDADDVRHMETIIAHSAKYIERAKLRSIELDSLIVQINERNKG